MKTIGILGGMTWESTITYYQVINEYISKHVGDFHTARCVMYSYDFQDIIETHWSGDWEKAGRILAEGGEKLKSIGADFLILATNTMHIVAPQVKAATGLPLLHIAEVTADRLLESGVKTVGLIGTIFTMEMDFYKDVLKQKGLEVLIPEKEARVEIQRVINEELTFGNFNEKSRSYYRNEIEKLKKQGAQGVILGCTEIGLLIKQADSPLPVFDTALIHAEETAKYAMAD